MSAQLTTTELVTLADEINTLHAKAESHAVSAIELAAQYGRKLIEAKSACTHGTWLPWLNDNFKGSQPTAFRYMKVAANYSRVNNLPEDERPDSSRQVIALLAEPNDKAKSSLLAIHAKAITEMKAATAALERDDHVLCSMYHAVASSLIRTLHNDFGELLANDPDALETCATLACSPILEKACANHRIRAHRRVGQLIKEMHSQSGEASG